MNDIKEFFNEFEPVIFEEKTIEIFEGEYHKGEAIVVRFVGRKKT